MTCMQAARSKLSKQSYTADAMRRVLREFQTDAAHCLLFLKHVRRVEVLECGWFLNTS